MRPAGSGGTHLGRYLHDVLGTPIGPKNERSAIKIPSWLREAGASTRLRWARVYVTLRAVNIDETRHGYALQLTEARSPPFREAFGRLLAGFAPTDSVTVGERMVLLHPAAAREFDVVPRLPEYAQRRTDRRSKPIPLDKTLANFIGRSAPRLEGGTVARSLSRTDPPG